MATYLELDDLVTGEDSTGMSDSEKLFKRTRMAVRIAMKDIVVQALSDISQPAFDPDDRTLRANRLWARNTGRDVFMKADTSRALNLIIAKNESATIAQINSATDAVLQSEVDLAVPFLIQARDDSGIIAGA